LIEEFMLLVWSESFSTAIYMEFSCLRMRFFFQIVDLIFFCFFSLEVIRISMLYYEHIHSRTDVLEVRNISFSKFCS
jgi:hypothetical protein